MNALNTQTHDRVVRADEDAPTTVPGVHSEALYHEVTINV